MRFYNLIKHRPIQEDLHEEIEKVNASSVTFHPIHGDYQNLEVLTKSFIAQTSRNKYWSMSESTFLNQIGCNGHFLGYFL
jgi:hypothetical protein